MARRITSLFSPNTKLMILLLIAVIFFNQYYAYASSSMALREGMDDGANKGKSQDAPKIIYFWMKGCGHCEKFKPTWEKFKADNKCPVEKEDISRSDSKFAEYKSFVTGFPTIVFMKDGQHVMFKGERTVDALNAFCAEHMG